VLPVACRMKFSRYRQTSTYRLLLYNGTGSCLWRVFEVEFAESRTSPLIVVTEVKAQLAGGASDPKARAVYFRASPHAARSRLNTASAYGSNAMVHT
jgi:hypothetical protein